MPIFWREGLKGPWIVIVCSDPYSVPESEQAMRAVFAHAPSQRPLRLLVDARHSTPPTPGVVARAGAFWQAHTHDMRGARVAIVVAHDGQSMARMSEMSAGTGPLPFEVAVFRDWKEAEQWLGTPDPDA